MTYQKEDVKYITTTFLVMFILALLNISIPVGTGSLFSTLPLGLLIGIIYALYRFRKYLASKNMKLLYGSMILALICSFIPLLVEPIYKDIAPQINLLIEGLFQTSFLPDQFNTLVRTLSLVQDKLFSYMLVSTLANFIPLLLMLISSAMFLDEVAKSRNLKTGKKVKKSFIYSGVFLSAISIFSLTVSSLLMNLVTMLSMDSAGKIVIPTTENFSRSAMMLSSGSSLVLIFGILYLVFFIRSLVLLNSLNKENENSNYTSYQEQINQNNFDK